MWVTRHGLSYSDLVFDENEIYIPGRVSRDQGFQFPKLRLGNLDARRDWGHAKDYVEAMWLMLQQDNPGDYVIGTGKKHSVEDFAKKAFDHVGLNYKDYITVDKSLIRPAEVDTLLANYSKAKKILKWEPKISFDELVTNMVDEDLKSLG